MRVYDVALIGCGNVAGMYGDATNKLLQTHAYAYSKNPRTNLVAAADIDKNRLDKFCRKWGVENKFLSVKQMMEDINPEIVSICSPTSYHYQHLKLVSSHSISGVFLEKPLSDDINECKKIMQMRHSFPIAINYFRRWNIDFQQLKENFDQCLYGDIKKVTAHYTKGLKNNGSHIIDLLLWFLGDLQLEKVLRKYLKIDNDFGVDCLLSSKGDIPITLIHIQEVDYVFIELEIICEKGLVRISQRGQKIDIYKKQTDPDYKVFNRLDLDQSIETRWNDSFSNAIENLVLAIEGKEKVSCTKEDAYKVSLLCEEILMSD